MSLIEIMGDRAEVAEPGHLANAIANFSKPGIDIETVRMPRDADLLVYARRVDTTLSEADRFCKDRNVPLVMMSTGLDEAIPTSVEYPLIIAPNTGLRVLRFLQRVEEQAARLEGWHTEVVEHHQPSKKDTSGTAKKLVEMLGIDRTDIVSVRDFEVSHKAYPAITESDQASYAAHKVTFTNPANGDQESTDILVLGREEYANGLIDIFHALQRSNVRTYIAEHENRVHIVDLLAEGLLD